METHRWTRTFTVLLLLLLPATYARAQAESVQRVRTDSRYLRVVLASSIERSPTFRSIVELRHALEIASAPWVVDEPTLSQFYQSIGFPTSGRARIEMFGAFETADALDAGERVHRELFHPQDDARVARNATK